MNLLFWKNNKVIDAFARSVADDLFSFISPVVAREHMLHAANMPKKRRIKVEQKLTDVILQIKRFSKANALGVYGKARLQQKFNERLEELGYPGEVVNKLSESILLENV